MRILDVGCGLEMVAQRAFPDAEVVRVDIREEMEPDVVADCRDLPESLGTFDIVWARHLLEHLGRRDVVPTLKHWAKFLVDGGQLHVTVPDLQWAVEHLWLHPTEIHFHVLMHIYCGQDYGEPSFHKWGYTALLLRSCLETAGYTVWGLVDQPYQIEVDDKRFDSRELYAVGVWHASSS